MSLSINFHKVTQVQSSSLDSGTVTIHLGAGNSYEGVTLYFQDKTHADAFATALRFSLSNLGDTLFPHEDGRISGKI